MAEELKPNLHVVVNQASWIIQGDLMAKFKEANNGEKYSADFQLHGCCWTIQCYPNGDTTESIDYVSVYLRCKNLPNECSKLGVNYQIDFVEVNEVKNGNAFFAKGQRWGWYKFLKRDFIMKNVFLTINLKVFVSATIDEGC
eukprot:117494_1